MTSCDIYFVDAPRFFGLVWRIIGPMLNEDTRSKITFTHSSDPSWLPRNTYLCVSECVYVSACGVAETGTEPEPETETETEPEPETETETETEKETETETEAEAEAETQTDKQTHTHTHRGREAQSDSLCVLLPP
jgi:hypothetical protein